MKEVTGYWSACFEKEPFLRFDLVPRGFVSPSAAKASLISRVKSGGDRLGRTRVFVGEPAVDDE